MREARINYFAKRKKGEGGRTARPYSIKCKECALNDEGKGGACSGKPVPPLKYRSAPKSVATVVEKKKKRFRRVKNKHWSSRLSERGKKERVS